VREPVVEVRDLSLAYRLTQNRVGSVKEFAINMVRGHMKYESLWALSEVSFDVSAGEVLAVIGPNGAGKSTLMKVIARILPPTEGRVMVRGTLAPMIELGAGFNGELTAAENIVLYGTILGRDPRQMRGRAEDIAEWAGLEEFLYVPIRSYSSGMLARLGFSIATDEAPDLLVVDEVLAVGDEAFQQKSLSRMKEMMAGGTSIILVSHALPTVLSTADRVIWLDHGHVRMNGDPAEVVGAYKESAVIE
jgi:ABC-2 type transport system ATP-binding protein/lipopolysaccharide transport system ATP-binding protein